MQNGKSRLPYRNPVLSDGLLAAPVAVFCDSFEHGLAASFILLCVMLIAVPLTALIPKKLHLPVRILLYSAVCALVYIPAVLFATVLFPEVSGGLWFALVAALPALTVLRDRYFGGKGMLRNLLRIAVTVPLLMTVCGALRELFGAGRLSGRTMLQNPPLPILCEPAGGLLLLCCICLAAVYLPKRIGKEAADGAVR